SRVKEKMRGTTSFTEIVKSQGKKPSSELISYKRVHPNEFEIKNLGVLPQSYVIRMERVRFADDLPVAYEIASIPEKIIRGFKESEITEHFFKTLTDNGYEIGKSQQTISASLANSSLAKHLKVKTGDALLSLTQISFLQDGQAFEYVRSYYVGDRFEFYLENN
ncbi:MAG: GntR family transcriptional regulator, partial [Streptococcus sp.]|nr:GntR family transcriptional regulator [Streptococcus sp.]